MFELVVGLTLFVMVAIIATILQVGVGYSYSRNPLLFSALYLVAIGLAAGVIGYSFDLPFLLVLIGIAGIYIVTISGLVRYWSPMQQLHAAHTIPSTYQGMVAPKLTGQFTKVVEVTLQDSSAWLIASGLLIISGSLTVSVLLFTLISFVTHIPGLWLFGKVYGSYFLIMVTLCAFLVPFLVSYGAVGYTILYTIHLSGYVLMYLFFGYWGTRRR